jgi:hypothetical protein
MRVAEKLTIEDKLGAAGRGRRNWGGSITMAVEQHRQPDAEARPIDRLV